jgi:hypothetical protein
MTLCPLELKWQGDAVLDVAAVDDLVTPPVDLTSGTATVTLDVFDADTGALIGAPHPAAQVGGTNVWRVLLFIDTSTGFAQDQRLSLRWTYDDGAGLRGYSETPAIVSTAG